MKVEIHAGASQVTLTGMTLNQFRLLVAGAVIGRNVAKDEHKDSGCTAPRCDTQDLDALVALLEVQAAPAIVLWRLEEDLKRVRNDAAAKDIAVNLITQAKEK